MKNKSTGTGEQRKKGFYAALATGGGAVLVLALVISFSNLTTGPDPQQMAYEAEFMEETVPAGADYTLPYQAQAGLSRSDDMDQALFRPRSTPSPEPSPEPSVEPNAPANLPSREAPAPEPAAEPESTTPTTTPNVEPETESEAAPPSQEQTQAAPAAEVAAFDPFTESDRLLWPVYGDIAMVFSQDRLVYNPTLDQWRTNDDLRITAEEGTPVRAAAAGKVVEIGNDRVYGNFVRIDNGNGWETIFGQLMDGILVLEGDVVQAGQVIGGVGRPSVFSVLNGHHVSMRVLHENNLMDPKLLLAEAAE